MLSVTWNWYQFPVIGICVGTPTGVVSGTENTTNGEATVAFNEHVLEVQADHPAVGLSGITSTGVRCRARCCRNGRCLTIRRKNQ